HVVGYSVVAASDDPSLPVLREAFADIYKETAVNGWMVLDNWRDGRLNVGTLTCLIPCSLIMTAHFHVALLLAWGTYRGIDRIDASSAAYRSFQLKILTATFVPLLFVYIPFTCVIYFPFFGIPDYGITYAFPVLVSFFPAWDAIIIISLMKDYR
ncbi:hypothetical protein PENTCL1PPCAC_14741, partial [Pristionchus entomophagus]